MELTIAAVNDAPVANNDTFATDLETVLDRTGSGEGLLANDFDIDSETLTVLTNQIIGPNNGQLSIDAEGGFIYTPNIGFSGTDTFTYVITDGINVSERATVTIEVASDPDAPVANPDTYQAAANNTLTVTADEGILANDFDPNGATIVPLVVTTTQNGVLDVNADGSFTYTPAANFVGTDTFTYLAMNVALVSPTTTVTIEVVDTNLAPTTTNDSYVLVEDGTLTTFASNGVLSNDLDPDGDSLTASLVSGPANGDLTFQADGSFTYTPDADFSGSDSFVYSASDGELSTNGMVTLTVAPEQDPPVATDDSYELDIDTVLTVSAEDGVLANDSDPDPGTLLTAVVVDEPTNGSLVLNSDGSFEYTPTAGFLGLDSFTYLVSDGVATREGTVTLNVQPEGELVTIRLEATDLNGNVIDTINAGESFLLRMFVADTSPEPVLGVFAAYADIEWQSSLAFVDGDFTFNPDYPNGPRGDISTPGRIDGLGSFSRLDEGTPDEFLLVSVPFEATGSGQLTFTSERAIDPTVEPTDPFFNVLLFDTLEIAVPPEQISYGFTTLTVVGPTAPVAIADEYDADNGIVQVAADNGVLANDADFSGSDLTATLVTSTSNGSLVLNSDGSFNYLANTGFVGADSFTYRATENGIESNVTTVTINVGDPTPSSLSGFVYFDTNNDGIREDSEHGFGGITVTLTGTDIFGNSVAQTAVTTRTGSYSFLNISAGSYTVTQEQPEIAVDGMDTIDGVPSILNDAFMLELGANTDLTNVNFGERGLMPQFIRSTMFMSSRSSQALGIGLGPDGVTSWYCSDASWAGLRNVQAVLAADGSTVTVTGINNTQQLVSGTFSTNNANVRVLGSSRVGYFVQLIGPASSFEFSPVGTLSASAVDQVFGN